MSILNYYQDKGSPITAEVVTNPIYIIEPDQLKIIDKVYFFTEPQTTLKALISYDNGDWEMLGQLDKSPKRFDCGMKKAYQIRFKLIEASSSKPFQWDGYQIIYELSEERR